MLKGENSLRGEGLYIAYERLIQRPSLTKKGMAQVKIVWIAGMDHAIK